MAYLNLEHSFGDATSLRVVFSRALQHNDPKKLHLHMVGGAVCALCVCACACACVRAVEVPCARACLPPARRGWWGRRCRVHVRGRCVCMCCACNGEGALTQCLVACVFFRVGDTCAFRAWEQVRASHVPLHPLITTPP